MSSFDNFRAVLLQLLHLRCVFPVSDHLFCNPSYEYDNALMNISPHTICSNKYEKTLFGLFVARCMKEKTIPSQKVFIEDVVTRLRLIQSSQSFGNEEETTIIEVCLLFVLSILSLRLLLPFCYSQALKYLSENVFGNAPIIELDEVTFSPHGFVSLDDGNTSHAGISRALKLIKAQNKILIIHMFAKHSLLSVSRFHCNTTLASGMLANTTGIGCKDIRLRFIIYQLFQAVAYLHSRGLCLESLNPCDIMLDDEMWVYLPVGLSNRLLYCAAKKVGRRFPLHSASSESTIQGNPEEITAVSHVSANLPSIPRPIDYYEPLSIQWISGKISNFEYLMVINYAAGRTMIDPLYHPILPWVTDFTTNCLDILEPSSYRDLSKTKFRLSKGDTQLETTFRHSDPPHHIPESLSELTYYIYLARRTPMQVLRRVVRDVFVPEHYPQSMHRIYEWTPDECIPEFYMDSSVFNSVHKNYGLTDLEVPGFPSFFNSLSSPSACASPMMTPDEFIRYHREVLESDYVSENLHLWIDLTFGYCLEGEAAIEHMNVPLHHTLSSSERQGLDSPNVNKNPGFVMLFDTPHPKKQGRNNHRIQSHVYSFKNEKEVNYDDFLSLNSCYQLKDDHKENDKYATNPVYLGGAYLTEEGGLEGLEEYAMLDRDNQIISKVFRINASAAHRDSVSGTSGTGNTTNRALANTVSPTDTSASMISANSGVSGNQAGAGGLNSNNLPAAIAEQIAMQRKLAKKSLIKPVTDITWSKLKYLEDVDLAKDKRGEATVHNLLQQTDHYRFADRTSAYIDSCYQLPSLNTAAQRNDDQIKKEIAQKIDDGAVWDEEFVFSVQLLEETINRSRKNQEKQTKKTNKSEERLEERSTENDEDILEKYQEEDMFAIGCMIAELYNGRSLLSKNDCLEISKGLSFKEIIAKSYKKTTGMPLVLQRLISLLLQSSSACRPKAREIIETCSITNIDNSSFPPEDYELLEEDYSIIKSKKQLQRFARIRILSDYCSSLFPDYFSITYNIISYIKLQENGILRLNALLQCIDDIAILPIDGINLGLVHFLEVISDSDCFSAENQQLFLSSASSSSSSTVDIKEVLSNYWRIVDVLSLRLGIESTEKLLVPHINKFLITFTAIDLLRDLLFSPLVNILAIRCGVKCFLRTFLPILLTYLSAGTLHHVLVRKFYDSGVIAGMGNSNSSGFGSNGNGGSSSSGSGGNDNIPLWTNNNTKISEKDEWLKKSSLYSIHRLQRASVSAIANLCEIDSLGSGICARYIIPSLLSLVGVPQLASSGFEPRKSSDGNDGGSSGRRPSNDGPNSSVGQSSTSTTLSPPQSSLTNELAEKVFEELVNQSVNTRRTLLDNDRPALYDIARVPYEQSFQNDDDSSLTTTGSKVVSPPIAERISQAWFSDKSLLESCILKHATFNAEHMYVVKVIVEMGTKLGDVVISELILSNIVNIILPELENQLNSTSSSSSLPVKPGIAAALMEIILLLNGLLPILSPETIQHDLLQPSRLSGSCIPKLLSIWPLIPAFSFLDDSLADDTLTVGGGGNGSNGSTFNILSCIESVRMHIVLLELCRLIVSMSMIVGPDLTSEYVLPHLDKFFANFVSSYGIFPVESKTMLKAFELGAEIYLPLVQIVSAEAFYTTVPNLNPRLEMWLRGIGSNIPPTSPPLPPNIWPEITSEVSSRPEKKKAGIISWIRGSLMSSSSNASTGTTSSSLSSSSGSNPTPASIVPVAVSHPPSLSQTSKSASSTSNTFSLPSLTKSKSAPVADNAAYELLENQISVADTTMMTPVRARKLSSYRTPRTDPQNALSPFSPQGTELVEFEFSSSTTGGNDKKPSSGTLPSAGIAVSVLAIDENDIQQGTPYRRKKSDSTASTESERKRRRKKREKGDNSSADEGESDDEDENSVDSDDENVDEDEVARNSVSVVVVNDEDMKGEETEILLDLESKNGKKKDKVQRDNDGEQEEIEEENEESPEIDNITHMISPLDESPTISIPVNRSSFSGRKSFEKKSITPPTTTVTLSTNNTDHNNGNDDEINSNLNIIHPKAIVSFNEELNTTKAVTPIIIEVNNNGTTPSTTTQTPRVLFSPATPGLGNNHHNSGIVTIREKILSIAERKGQQQQHQQQLVINGEGENTNPYRRYQRLLNTRIALKNSRQNSTFLTSPLKIRNIVSTKHHHRSSVRSSITSTFNNQLSSNSNYLIINSIPTENETNDEMEFRESRYSELTWLLAGYGRWNVDKEMKDRLTKEQTKQLKSALLMNRMNSIAAATGSGGGGLGNIGNQGSNIPSSVSSQPTHHHHTSYFNSGNEWNPAAQMSMTAPKIAVDVVNDSSSFINFQLQANTQWKLEDPPGHIRCMITNPNETLLMTCSKTGVRLFSLSTHPILHVSSYTGHPTPPFNAAFLRDGQNAMTCDGSIHLWNIESRQALAIISPIDKHTASLGYSSVSVIPSKFGIHPTIDSIGDEQLLATIADTVSYFDIRCNHLKPLNRVAEWILPQIPPPQGNFISSTVEPLQLTCAYSHDNYVYAGSVTGGLFILDRRMGKLLNSWQAHDSPILKVTLISCFLTGSNVFFFLHLSPLSLFFFLD
jgi:hypothetical protein